MITRGGEVSAHSRVLASRIAVGAMVVGSLLVSVGCAKPQGAPSRELKLLTDDGVRLGATVYPVTSSRAPGLILVHMLGDDRNAWRPLLQPAHRGGYVCLSFDLRGHGASTRKGAKTLSYQQFSNEDWQGAVNDIAAAKAALIANGGDPRNIGIVGAGLGAAIALHYAAGDPDIVAVALLSPDLTDHGFNMEQDLAAYGMRPVLLMTSEDDSYSASACARLKARAPGFCELRSYPGSARGTDLLATSPNAIRQIIDWFDPILKSTKTPLPQHL